MYIVYNVIEYLLQTYTSLEFYAVHNTADHLEVMCYKACHMTVAANEAEKCTKDYIKSKSGKQKSF